MIILDTLLVGGIKFVLRKLVDAVEAQLNDDSVLREELLAAQMRLELGEISEEDFAVQEADLLARLREIHERQRGITTGPDTGDMRITGIEATTFADEPPDDEDGARRR
ncbi:MAG TPA: gas vesicle protein GvpG [Methylomirabilota bacterium]|nr:gas vesicle protein GvpG [Methylomirabilota bacterium]